LTAELIALHSLTDHTLTTGTFERYDDDGAMVLGPVAHGLRQPIPGEKHSPSGQLHVPIVWLFAGEQLPTEQVSGKGATILMQ
jgi:hypothetical protein